MAALFLMNDPSDVLLDEAWSGHEHVYVCVLGEEERSCHEASSYAYLQKL